MKKAMVLIVDDDPNKSGALWKAVLACPGAESSQVHICACAVEAKKWLSVNDADLLILDLVLPEYNGENPTAETGQRLLAEINDWELWRRPKYIVGITGYREFVEVSKSFFHERGWLLLHYDVTSNIWRSSLIRFVSYILAVIAVQKSQTRQVDVVLLTALWQPEYSALMEIGWDWSVSTPVDESLSYQVAEVVSCGRPIKVAACCVGRMGPVPAAITASKIISFLRPKALGLLGICAGLDDAAELGDIIVATNLWSWESGKLSGDADVAFSPDHVSFAVEPFFTNAFGEIALDKEWRSKVQIKWKGERISSLPKVIIGPVASGSVVVAADRIVKERVLSRDRKTVGLEMEGLATQGACFMWGAPRCSGFMVKGVCDFANSAKGDKAHALAAYTSVAASKELIERFGERLVGTYE